MEFDTLIQRAMEIRQRCGEFEQQTFGRAWTSEEIALGFVGDVGDLAKLVMAFNGIRNIADTREKLAHELADCLWSVVVLSQTCDVDLERAFLQTMDKLEEYLSTEHKKIAQEKRG